MAGPGCGSAQPPAACRPEGPESRRADISSNRASGASRGRASRSSTRASSSFASAFVKFARRSHRHGRPERDRACRRLEKRPSVITSIRVVAEQNQCSTAPCSQPRFPHRFVQPSSPGRWRRLWKPGRRACEQQDLAACSPELIELGSSPKARANPCCFAAPRWSLQQQGSNRAGAAENIRKGLSSIGSEAPTGGVRKATIS